MKFKIGFTLFILIGWIFVTQFVRVYMEQFKASTAVLQLEDSRELTAFARWFSGESTTYVLAAIVATLLFFVWRKTFKKEKSEK